MAISIDLRVLANKLEKSSDDLIVEAARKGPECLEKISTAIAAASTLLIAVADDMDDNASTSDLKVEDLDSIAQLSSKLAASKDPEVRKQASVLDEILLTIAAPKNAVAQANKNREDETNRLAEKYRSEKIEELYTEPKKALHKMHGLDDMAKAVDEQIKEFRPLEAPLQTRYSPDMPGTPLVRITDGVYQDVITGKIYDYKNGYTTAKGNKVPGSGVENQIRDLGDQRQQSSSLFENRESILNRYVASSFSDESYMKKFANMGLISKVLRGIRDNYPVLLNKAIDFAAEKNHLNTDEIATALSGDVNTDDDADRATDIFSGRVELSPPISNQTEEDEEIEKTRTLLEDLKAVGWGSMILDLHDAVTKAKKISKPKINSLFAQYMPKGAVYPFSENYLPKSTQPAPSIYDLVRDDEEDIVVNPDSDTDIDLQMIQHAFMDRLNLKKTAATLKDKFTPKEWLEALDLAKGQVDKEEAKKKDLKAVEEEINGFMHELGYPGPTERRGNAFWFDFINVNKDKKATPESEPGSKVVTLEPAVLYLTKEEAVPIKPQHSSSGVVKNLIKKVQENPSVVDDENFWKKDVSWLTSPTSFYLLRDAILSNPQVISLMKDPQIGKYVSDWLEYYKENRAGDSPKKQEEAAITEKTNIKTKELPEKIKSPEGFSTHNGYIIYVPEEKEESLKPDSYVSVFQEIKNLNYEEYKEQHDIQGRLTPEQMQEVREMIDEEMESRGYWPPYTQVSIPGKGTVKFGPEISKKYKWMFREEAEEPEVELLQEVGGKKTPHANFEEYMDKYIEQKEFADDFFMDYLAESLEREPTTAEIKSEVEKYIAARMNKFGFVSPFDIDPVSSKRWIDIAKSLSDLAEIEDDEFVNQYLLSYESKVNPTELYQHEVEQIEKAKPNKKESKYTLEPKEYSDWLSTVMALEPEGIEDPDELADFYANEMHALNWPAPFETNTGGVKWEVVVKNHFEEEDKKRKEEKQKQDRKQVEQQKENKITPSFDLDKWVKAYKTAKKDINKLVKKENEHNLPILQALKDSNPETRNKASKKKLKLEIQNFYDVHVGNLMFNRGFVRPLDIDHSQIDRPRTYLTIAEELYGNPL